MSSGGAVDILSMLNKAQAECNQQNSVAAFFKQIADQNSVNQTPSNNIDSLEQIERQFRPATQTNAPPVVVQNANPLAQFFNSNNLNNGVRKSSPNPQQTAAAKEKPTKTNGSTIQMNSNKTGPPPGYKQQEKKLITPTMLLNSCKDKPVVPPAAVAQQHQPLTKVQLIEAVRFLMETDEEFVTKVHDAYLKSVSSSSNGKKF